MTALLSVYNKTEAFKDFAAGLRALPVELLASSGTKKFLDGYDIPSKDVADLVGAPILGHRVVTLSREIFASILARAGNPEDIAELDRLGLSPIRLVYVDLYPLKAAVTDSSLSAGQVIEMIDIGGPTLLRAAAKAGALVVSKESHFEPVLQYLQGHPQPGLREFLAMEAEGLVSAYADTASQVHRARFEAARRKEPEKWRHWL